MEKEIIKPSTAPLSLEVVIAERIFSLFRADGTEVQITARLGKPYKEKSLGDYRCPSGPWFGNDRIYAPWGEDPFVALQYAIDYIGQLLDAAAAREQLQDGRNRRSATENRWIWRYPPDHRQGRD
jgi:hypothetical protein